MGTHNREPGLAEKAGPYPARTDEQLGGDDIGLPAGIQPEGAAKPISPDPDKSGPAQRNQADGKPPASH